MICFIYIPVIGGCVYSLSNSFFLWKVLVLRFEFVVGSLLLLLFGTIFSLCYFFFWTASRIKLCKFFVCNMFTFLSNSSTIWFWNWRLNILCICSNMFLIRTTQEYVRISVFLYINCLTIWVWRLGFDNNWWYFWNIK